MAGCLMGAAFCNMGNSLNIQGAWQHCWRGFSVLCRCRHAVAAVGPYVFIYGGLKGSTLLDDFLLADDSSGAEMSICDPRSPTW